MTITETAASTQSTSIADEVQAWAAANWDPDLTLAQWWERLADSGWAVPSWPEQWFGKGLSRDEAGVVAGALRKAGVLGPPTGLGMLLAGPTIVTHGTEEQRRRYLRPIVTGQEAWCQLFSEPNAGSDLAGLQTRAERDGDEWVITGQKVWTSGAHYADLGMLLARTDLDAPKHRGISYYAIDMDQPGIDVRPLREMTGRALFNEVFLDAARVGDDALIGGRDNGWAVANTTLANERAGLGAGGSGGGGGPTLPGRKAGMLDRRVGDLVGGAGTGAGALGLMGRGFDLLKLLAEHEGRTTDAVIRQDLARLYTVTEIGRYTVMRGRAAKAAGRGPGPEANTAKLSMSRMMRLSRDLGMAILGAKGTLAGKDAPFNGAIQELACFASAVSIYGGSDEIQKNIIGERVLGLPREPGNDRDIPFRELLANQARNRT